MNANVILRALSKKRDRWPGDALVAAAAQKRDVAPLLLEELNRAAVEIEALEAAEYPEASVKRFLKGRSPLFFGVFLLGNWGETAAYRPLARLMRFPWVGHDNCLGEPALEEPGYRLMAAVFDGDPQPIFDIILDGGATSSVRFWQWHALTWVVLQGKLDRTAAAEFGRQAFDRLSEEESSPLIWDGWEKLVSRLALADLAPLVQRAHAADRMEESTYEGFEQDLDYARAHPQAPWRPGDELAPFAGVSELEAWVSA